MSLAACGGGGGGTGGLIQSISFDYPGGGTLKAGPVKLKATASSGLPVAFKAGTPEVCTVSGDEVTLVKVGECLVYANQPGGKSADGRQWAAADETAQVFNVLKHPQAVTLPAYVVSAQTTSAQLPATADSGLPMTYTTSTPQTCAITGTTLQLKQKGACLVEATQPGDADYSALKTQSYVAVDPLIVADGFTPESAGKGSSTSMRTKQGGAVAAIPWQNTMGWQSCDSSNGDWCYRTVSADGSGMTSALHVPESKLSGWWTGENKIDIFTPGITGLNWGGDTTGGLQVTTETVLGFTLGVNLELYLAGKPVLVGIDLGKSNGGGCNVQLRAQLWPMAAGLQSYFIGLSDFAVTDDCGLGVAKISEGDVRNVPTPWGGDDKLAAYRAALDKPAYAAARASATTLLKSSGIVRTHFWVLDPNWDKRANGFAVTDVTIKGPILIQ
ncbi:hypothetical protein ASC95_18335 [Pelomonas sp. Root1217]|nr:hypothetical protein ASC95_18335 [Pelomonas sp. Root1217]